MLIRYLESHGNMVDNKSIHDQKTDIIALC